ncbi:hypothetical protein LINPERPRIM_LOCUS40382 [Linum perenne]
MRWEIVCVRKEDGGMGFRSFRSFNLTLLFKAKYFPYGDFLSADLSGSPNKMWKNIQEAQVVIPRPNDMGEICVKDLMIPGTKEWDTELIEDVFSSRDAHEILSIALSPQEATDERIWQLSRKWEYNVRVVINYESDD